MTKTCWCGATRKCSIKFYIKFQPVINWNLHGIILRDKKRKWQFQCMHTHPLKCRCRVDYNIANLYNFNFQGTNHLRLLIWYNAIIPYCKLLLYSSFINMNTKYIPDTSEFMHYLEFNQTFHKKGFSNSNIECQSYTSSYIQNTRKAIRR